MRDILFLILDTLMWFFIMTLGMWALLEFIADKCNYFI